MALGKTWARLGLLVAALGLAGNVEAQTLGAIAGLVTDATGGVLPGVTVEASSPALIEGARTAVTDGQGRYSIVSLPPGTYAVNFTLSGFSVVRREGVTLNAGFTAPVNAELKVGSLEETVTVTGASPTVDVRNVRTQAVMERETLDQLPSAQNVTSFASLTLGATLSGNGSGAGVDVGGSGGPMGLASVHNSRGNDMKTSQDGMNTNNSMGTNGGIMHFGQVYNMEAVSEVVLSHTGMNAETETAGLQINYIPKDGGNRVSFSGRATFANEDFQSDNLTDGLRARGVTTASTVKEVSDYGFGLGGPIQRDRLWFHTAHRWWKADTYAPGSFWNAAHGQKAANGVPLYVADTSRRGFNSEPSRENSVRLTWQASSKDKIGYYGNLGHHLQVRGVSATLAPEAEQIASTPANHLSQATLTRTQSNRLLFEAGLTVLRNPFEFQYPDGVGVADVSIVELSPQLSYNARSSSAIPYNVGDPSDTDQVNWRASMAYVTGSHNVKVGMQWAHGWIENNGSNNPIPNFGPVQVVTNRGVPISLTLFVHPQYVRSDFRNMGVYAQDQWTVGRATLNLGVRGDFFDGWSPDQTTPENPYVPVFRTSRVDGTPRWRDISPRLGFAYDLTGDGKTAIKVSAGKYMAGMGTQLPLQNNPGNAISKTTTRTWNDANQNFFPEGDPRNPAANGELGPSTNAAFGTSVITNFFDPAMLTDNRPYTWQISTSVERELREDLRLSVGYFRTSHYNQTIVDNTAVTPSDYDSFCITTPSHAALPGGGGQRVCGFADVSFAGRARVPRNTTKPDSTFGDQTEEFNGIDVEMRYRFGEGGLLQGGVSLGQTVNNSCIVVDSPQGISGSVPFDFCKVTVPWWDGNGQFKVSAAYPLPYGVEFSAIYQNLVGPAIQATATMLNASIAPALGRNLSACASPVGACIATASLSLIEPNTLYEERVQQIDLRFAKVFNTGIGRTRATFDLYNATNASSVLNRNNAFGTSGVGWGRPTAIMGGRLIKLGVQHSWN
ncbi:MAG: TonB-dependent receptor [Acidimicrobiia bacterium]|nr:TonB-dependent receptor [Acidimicrobiia bacterium]